MNWNPMNWLRNIPVTESTGSAPNVSPEATLGELSQARSDVSSMQKRLASLESLLDVQFDPDEHLPGSDRQSLYRQVTGGKLPDDSGRDFSTAKRLEILRLSHQTYSLRGDAHNIIEIPIDFIVGDDLAPEAKDINDTKLQKEIDDIWFDPRNKLWLDAEEYTRSVLLEGELFLLADMSEDDGHLELTYHPPENVVRVLQDDRRRDNFIEINDPDASGQTLSYFVLNNMDDKIEITRVSGGEKNKKYSIKETTDEGEKDVHTHGLVFLMFNSRPKGATRGRPWLTEVLDYIDGHDQLIWSQVEREKLLKLFIIDIEAKDVKDKASATAKLVEMGLKTPPTDPVVLCHNDKVKIKLHAPETSGTPLVSLEQVMRHNIYGAKGLPEHWSGSGGGSNFATARAQDLVPLRRLRRKQKQIVNFWLLVIRVSLRLMRAKGASHVVENPEFDLRYLEVGGRDRQRGAVILKDAMVAISQATSQGIITVEAANEIFMQIANEGGFEISREHRGIGTVPEADDEFETNVSRVIAAKKRKTSQGEEQGEEDPVDRQIARAT